jgi:hypothetical protein
VAGGIVLGRLHRVSIQPAPPAQPEPMPTPCARCGCEAGIHLYATSRVRYYGCVQCRYLTVVPNPRLMEWHSQPHDPSAGR